MKGFLGRKSRERAPRKDKHAFFHVNSKKSTLELQKSHCWNRNPARLRRCKAEFLPRPFGKLLERDPWIPPMHSLPPAILQRHPISSDSQSPAPPILPFSSDCHSPATTILQRLPFSSDYHSPATTILQRLPFSSDYHSPAPAILQRATSILQRLPFSSDYHSPATTILQRLPFSSATILQVLHFSGHLIVKTRQAEEGLTGPLFVLCSTWQILNGSPQHSPYRSVSGNKTRHY